MTKLEEIEARLAAATLSWLPGYEVRADGTLWSMSSNWRGYGPRALNGFPDHDGYLRVHAIRDGRRVRLRVHQVVAEAFHGPRPTPRHEVRHLDGDRCNNVATNLQWGTRRENAGDRARHGRTARGSRNGQSRLREVDIPIIRSLVASGQSHKKAGAAFGVSARTVFRIIRGELWTLA